MSNAPEWVDESAEPPEPTRIDARELSIEMFRAAMASMVQAYTVAFNALANLSEMGESVKNTGSRLAKTREWMNQTTEYFDYDIVNRNATPTKTERLKGENYELS